MNNPIQNVKEKLTKQNLKTFLLITFGTFIFAIGIYFFKFPNNFSTGGVSGISILLGRIFPSFSTADIMWIINIILLIVGFIILGRGFGVLTVYCSMLLSFLTWLFEKVIPLSKPLTDQPFLELCYGMMLPAVGSAILFNCNASSGGTDIVAMILKKYTSLDIGKALLVSDALIAFSATFVFDIRTGLFSLLGLAIKAFMVDSVIEGINLCKYFSIVTTHPEEICDYIIHKMNLYEKLGIYSLIAQISNGKFLDDYVESRIGELIKADQMQEGGLCETLETYLAHNCNANAAAEYLFIHRNTMRYRMDKIKRILDDDINDMEVFLELKLAFAIKRYRENRTE